MLPELFTKGSDKIIISTGNILNVNKKTGQKPTEELIDCLKATIEEPVVKSDIVSRFSDDLVEKIREHERSKIKIGGKVFINSSSVENLEEAVNTLLRILNVQCLDNLILAYHPKQSINSFQGSLENDENKDLIQWNGANTQDLEDLKLLWKHLEKYSANKICQLGISDLDVNSLREVYTTSTVKPSITQINLSACCVVPPELQVFCNENDIQLLTHSDPEVILTEEELSQLGLCGFEPNWAVRYQVHVRCRGLLTAKGYIVGSLKTR